MGAFDEIISGGPYAVYIAPVGTFYGPPWATPGKPWTLLGVNGPMSTTEEGISISATQTYNKVYALGTTAPVKSYRLQEEFEVTINLQDLRPDTWIKILRGHGASVELNVPTPTLVGYISADMLRGGQMAEFACLIRLDVSPYDNTFRSQFEIYRAVQTANQQITLDKGSNPAQLTATFSALYDPVKKTTARYRAMYARATG